MVNRYGNIPTAYFWNCLGTALFVISVGVAISVARTEALNLEVARYKLQTGVAIDKVRQASDTLATEAKKLPPKQKQQVKAKIAESNKVLERRRRHRARSRTV